MQSWGCQMAFSARAVRAGKNARFSTDVVQSDEAEGTVLPFVFDDDDGRHTQLAEKKSLNMLLTRRRCHSFIITCDN